MKKVIATFTLLLCLLLISLNTIAANDNLEVKDKNGTTVNIEELKKSLNYQTTIDRYSIDKLLDYANIQQMDKKLIDFVKPWNDLISLSATATTYGCAWPYSAINTASPNCYGYAMAFNFALNPGDLSNPNGALPPGYTQSQIRSYFDVNNIANNVVADLQKLYRTARFITSATSTISSSERRIAVRTGMHDFDGDGSILQEYGEADYHFMLQHSNGDWSEKHGSNPSINDGQINPSTFSWNAAGYSNYYNSATVYIAVSN